MCLDILVTKNFVPEALKSHSTTDCLELFTSAKEFIEDGANRLRFNVYIASVLNDERYPAGTDWFYDAISGTRTQPLLETISDEFNHP